MALQNGQRPQQGLVPQIREELGGRITAPTEALAPVPGLNFG
jgi:hypothetical protein